MASEDVVIRSIKPTDAAALLRLARQLQTETSFVTFDNGLELDEQSEALEINAVLNSPNNAMFVAALGEQLIGFVRISAASDYHMCHIGELGIAVLKDYWHYGLGHLLMATAIDWVQHTPMIHRLELTVQQRNQRAIALYHEFGFQDEAVMQCGYFDDQVGDIPVVLMAMMINHC